MNDYDDYDESPTREEIKAMAKLVAENPNHCRKCRATGVIQWTENGAPHGAGYWPMDMADSCDSCVNEGKCPRCGSELDDSEEYWDRDVYDCLHCDWRSDDGIRIDASELPVTRYWKRRSIYDAVAQILGEK